MGKELEGKERDEREEKFLIIVSFFICFHDRFIYITPKASPDRCCVLVYMNAILVHTTCPAMPLEFAPPYFTIQL